MEVVLSAAVTGLLTLIISVINLISNNKNAKKKDLIAEIDKVQLDNCKNYLVQLISAADRRELSPAEIERYWENYDKYIELGGNSYIHRETDRLKSEGKI